MSTEFRPGPDRPGPGESFDTDPVSKDPVADPVRRQQGFGPFITLIETERPDGIVARWDSRRHRKQARPSPGGELRTWWDPRARGWWIAVLFAVGSALFALGAVPGYVEAVGSRPDSITFFVGSLFFTCAGFLQYRESVDAGSKLSSRGLGKVFVWRPGQIDWWASGIQLIGTLYFNVSTGDAVRVDLTAQAAHQHLWRPDAVGSICFLVASGLAWFEVCHGWMAWSPTSISWRITALNLVGSIAFGVSAVAGYIVPSTGQIRNVELSNLGTFVGALCFLVGAVLLLPERTAGSPSATVPAAPTPSLRPTTPPPGTSPTATS
jgi:YrhK-like protein